MPAAPATDCATTRIADHSLEVVAPLDPAWFAGRMIELGPWVGGPVAVAVSGGADSLCLALMLRDWLGSGGSGRPAGLIALVVDHGLRPRSAQEAATTAGRLHALGVPVQVITLAGLRPGSGLPARARIARYAALSAACRASDCVDMLLGHHAGDQAETVAMRGEAGSGPAGLAGMAPVVETAALRLVRPLLDREPAELRATLRAAGLQWVEDPSNTDVRWTRPRWRRRLAAMPELTRGLLDRAAVAACRRDGADRDVAAVLAERVRLGPDGVACLRIAPSDLPIPVLAALVRVVGGAEWPPGWAAVRRLVACGEAGGTLGGTRLRLGRGGWWLVREPAACAAPIPAVPGAVWDGRFRLSVSGEARAGDMVAALGGARMPDACRLPPAWRRAALPAIHDEHGRLRAVPHLGWAAPGAGGYGFQPAWQGVLARSWQMNSKP